MAKASLPLTVFFCADINHETVAEIQRKLRDMHESDLIAKRYVISITTDGGLIEPAMALVSTIHRLRREGRHITCHVAGGAYSGGATVLQAGAHRTIDRYGFLMTHEPQSDFENWKGSSTELKAYQDQCDRAAEAQVDFFAHRTGHTVEYLRENFFTGRDMYIDAQTALDYNLVDEILELPL